MNSIAFKNFRRFTNFPTLEYGGITMLVGKNNSGKSTMVKALLLIHDFLKSKNVQNFTFGNSIIEDANIVTFDRALNFTARESAEYFITFTHQFANFRVSILVTGEQNKTEAKVINYAIEDLDTAFVFNLSPVRSVFTIDRTETNEETESPLLTKEIDSQIALIESTLKNTSLKPSSKEYIELIDNLSELKKKRNSISKTTTTTFRVDGDDSEDIDLIQPEVHDNSFQVTSYLGESSDLSQFVAASLTDISNQYDLDFRKTQLGETPSENFENLRVFYHFKSPLEDSIKSFIQTIDNLALVYLGANPAKQSALFAIRDKNNALAQAIHEYKQLNIDKDKGKDAYKFIEKWMKLFEVGDSFTAELHAGEAYEVLVSDKNSQIALADKGMGSIQAMLLIVRLGCIIAKAQKFNKDYTVIIEEPELNLHPALQSKLADLFHEVYSNYKIKLIVETHSEYLIRKTQLIVKEKEYEVKPNVNPFYTYYFDIDKGQWKMNYREDGKFVDEFGSGFYDESAILTLNLL